MIATNWVNMAVRLFWSMLRWGTFRQHGASLISNKGELTLLRWLAAPFDAARSIMARDGGPVIWAFYAVLQQECGNVGMGKLLSK
jgi:hypothetical protein